MIHDGGAVAIQQILHAGRYGGIDLGYCVQPSALIGYRTFSPRYYQGVIALKGDNPLIYN